MLRRLFSRNAMPSKLLISFCNLKNTSTTGLLLYDLNTDQGDWIRLIEQPTVRTATGIVKNGQRVYCAFRSEKGPQLAVLDASSLQVINVFPLPIVSDVHSITVHKQILYVVSTSTDSIISYSISDDALGEPTEFWTPTGANQDTHHLNAIHKTPNGQIICSGFGPKSDKLWASAQNGYIYNITTGKYVIQGINHPHSIVCCNHQIFYCESSTASVKNNVNQVIQFEEGYIRGPMC